MNDEENFLDQFLNDDEDPGMHFHFMNLSSEDGHDTIDEALDIPNFKATQEAFIKSPLFKKVISIYKIVETIAESLDEQADSLNMRTIFLQSAGTIFGKLMGINAEKYFSWKMELATVVKNASKELASAAFICSSQKFADPEYLALMVEEIEDFRKLFNDWIKTFDPTIDMRDEWAIGYHHQSPREPSGNL